MTLAEGLSGMGHHVAYAGPLDGWLGSRMRSAGYACMHLPMHGMYDLWSAWRLAKFCRIQQATLLHGHAQRGARYSGWAARRLGLPAVATAHSTQGWKWFDRDTTLIAVSRAVRDALVAAGIRSERIHVVHSGVEDIGATPLPGASAPGRTGAADRSGQVLVLGMLSRLERVKGHDIALEALASIRSRLPVRLVVVGPEDTEWARQIRAKATALGLDDLVEFQGLRNDLPAAFSQFDVVLSPSRREALSLTLIEAAAAARPSIAADIGGIPEVVVHEQTGLLVPPEDPDALARAILRLGTDPELRARLARRARERYEQEFTIDAMIQKTLSVYTGAIAGQAGKPR
ncbi:MAG: glycosyltransferase family 4 protein [Burkholderiaceae bacterium]|nr:glycosyltransferase family 4 protein [Burkholderiaceae bacterium]